MRKLLLAGVMLGLLSTAAAAADLGGPRRGSYKDAEPYYPPPFSWTGLYVGLQAGWAWGDLDGSNGFNQSSDIDGFVGGAHIGYNLQSGTIVWGIEADIEGSDLGGSGPFHDTNINWLGSLRARFGLTVTPRTLLYATGGLAFGDVEVSNAFGTFSDTRTGWTLGAGLEHAISPATTVRLEYRYTDLGSNDNAPGVGNSDVTFGAVRAGISWKF
jgi:outer membrane immunogenic protein